MVKITFNSKNYVTESIKVHTVHYFTHVYTKKHKMVKHLFPFYCFGTGKALDTYLSCVESQYEIGKGHFCCVISCNKCQ